MAYPQLYLQLYLQVENVVCKMAAILLRSLFLKVLFDIATPWGL